MSTKRPTPVPQRRRTASVHLKAAPSRSDLSKAARDAYAREIFLDAERLRELSATVKVEVIRSGREGVIELDDLRDANPLELHEVRRPPSWTERVNRTTLFVVKARRPTAPYATWAESLNEVDHLRDLLHGVPDRLLVTQALRLTWSLDGFTLVHYPDILSWSGEFKALCDVTSGRPLPASQTLAWELSARLCETLGWGYEVRLPLGRQRSRNLRVVEFCADVDPATVRLAERMLEGMPERRSLQRLLVTNRSQQGNPLRAALHLLANGRLFLDLDLPISRASWLSRHLRDGHRPPPGAPREQWLSVYTERVHGAARA